MVKTKKMYEVRGTLNEIRDSLSRVHTYSQRAGAIETRAEVLTTSSGRPYRIYCADGSRFSVECAEEEAHDMLHVSPKDCSRYIARFIGQFFPLLPSVKREEIK